MPLATGLRIGLVAKVFDLASSMEISPISTWKLLPDASQRDIVARRRHLPEYCLSPGRAGAAGLIMPNTRVSVDAGHVYVQPSLTNYYEAFLAMEGSSRGGVHAVSQPVRVFDQESLMTADGSSVLERLTQECSCVVVEDMDLRPQELLRHFRSFSLNSVRALDMKRAMQLVSNYSYLLWDSSRQPSPPVQGDRIW